MVLLQSSIRGDLNLQNVELMIKSNLDNSTFLWAITQFTQKENS
jgi:hypothetical protein